MFAQLLTRLPHGMAYMLLSALGFALMGACVKEVSRTGIPIFEIVAARALVSLVLSYADIYRKRISPWGNNPWLLISRGGAGAIALFCTYFAITTLPLAEATVLQYLHPVFTALLALIFLKEAIQRSTLISIGLSLLGLAIIIQPSLHLDALHALPPLSILAALAGAFGSAVAYVLVRRLSREEDGSVIIFYFPLITLPVALTLLGSDFIMPNLRELVLLILVGVFTQIGQIGLTNAMKTSDASKATAYSYVQIIFSAIIGWVYFHEVPLTTTVIGSAFIVAGALVNIAKK